MVNIINKRFLELLYDAACIQRWNDHLRPCKGFTELDKQAHKFFYVYVLAKFEETESKQKIDWLRLIEGGIFEYLHRVELTDIKPPIFHRLMEQKGGMLNDWVLRKLEDDVRILGGGFLDKFRRYLCDPDYSRHEKKILKASHFLASKWEFQIIYKMNSDFYGLEQTKEEIENEIEEHYDLPGVRKLVLENKTKSFLDLVGQLRFQQRWAQSPRIPETSVIGHMLIVAIMGYVCSMEIGACEVRVVNNFFAGLFHDLSEVLTRDIISPIKKSVEGLDILLKSIEHSQLEKKILPLLPQAWRSGLRYFVEEEFASKILVNGEKKLVSSDEISEKYNSNEYSPVDGEILKICDHLAAYIEAYLSINNGIRHHRLIEGYRMLYGKYDGKIVAGQDFGHLFNYFNPDH